MIDTDSNVEIEDDIRSMEPHSKQYMTSRLGRLVERSSYLDMAILTAMVLFGASLYFATVPEGWGLKQSDIGFDDAFYYSVVTFTTVGYGEFTPVGAGRYVAMALAACGLSLTAVLIGKVASERQSSLLLLLHTSDTQRRISKFDDEIVALRSNISLAKAPFTAATLECDLVRMRTLAVAIKRYLGFNSFQAGIASFGNTSTLASLYEELGETFRLMMAIMRKTESREVIIFCREACKHIDGIMRLMDRQHNIGVPSGSLVASAFRKYLALADGFGKKIPSGLGEDCALLAAEFAIALQNAEDWLERGYNPIQVERVYRAFPAIPRNQWPTGMHREIAAGLAISHTVLSKCVDELLIQKRLPKVSLAKQLLDL